MDLFAIFVKDRVACPTHKVWHFARIRAPEKVQFKVYSKFGPWRREIVHQMETRFK
jgi:hypothetical protein